MMPIDILAGDSSLWLLLIVIGLGFIVIMVLIGRKDHGPFLFGGQDQGTTITKQEQILSPDSQLLESKTITIMANSSREAKLLYDLVKSNKEGYNDTKK